MSALLYGHDKEVAKWVGEKAKQPFSEEYLETDPLPYRSVGILDSAGTLVAGFVFSGHNRHTMELSVAGSGVRLRSGWSAALDYVFGTAACSRLQIHTRRSNKRVLRQLAKLGFKHEGTARRFYGDEDAICYALTKNDLAAFREKWKL